MKFWVEHRSFEVTGGVMLAHSSCHLQVLVPGNINTAFLDQLLPDTPYSVNVVALYADGEGQPVSDDGKTCKTPSLFDTLSYIITILHYVLAQADRGNKESHKYIGTGGENTLHRG